MGLGAEGTQRHRAGNKAAEDRIHALDLIQRNRLRRGELEKSAQGAEVSGLVVDIFRVFLVLSGVVVLDRLTEKTQGGGIPEVVFAVRAEAVLSARGKDSGFRFGTAENDLMFDIGKTDSADTGDGSGEIAFNERGIHADGLENLRGAIAAQSRDAHFGHDLEKALVDGVDVVFRGARGIDRDLAVGGKAADRFEREIGVDGGGAIAQQKRVVHDLADFTGLDDDADRRTESLVAENAVDGGHGEKRGNRHLAFRKFAVAEDQDVVPGADIFNGGLFQLGKGVFEAVFPADGKSDRGKCGALERAQTAEVFIGQDRTLKLDELVVFLRLVEDIALVADVGGQTHDQFLADRVDRGIGDLREELFEVVVEELGTFGKDCQSGVVAHGADGLVSGLGHDLEDQFKILAGPAEKTLAEADVFRDFGRVDGIEESVYVDLVFLGPAAIRLAAGDVVFEFGVKQETLVLQIAVDHLAGLEASLADHFGGGNVQHAGFRSENEKAVLREGVAGGAQAVAVEKRAGVDAVGESDRGGTVPRLHQCGMVIEEPADVAAEMVVDAPRLWDQHEHGVREGASGGHEELEHVIQTGRVALSALDEREQLREIVPEQRTPEERFASCELVEVSAESVDFSVVRQTAERMRELPCGECVRAVTLVDQREGALEIRIGEVGVETVDLSGKEESLVDDAPAGATGDITLGNMFLDEAADDEELALEDRLIGERLSVDENLADEGTGFAGDFADASGADRHLADGDDFCAFGTNDLFDLFFLAFAAEEHHDGIGAFFRERCREDFTEEFIGDGSQDTGSVACFGVAAGGAAMHEAFQDGDTLFHDFMLGLIVQVRDKADAASIVFVLEAVKTAIFRKTVGMLSIRSVLVVLILIDHETHSYPFSFGKLDG